MAVSTEQKQKFINDMYPYAHQVTQALNLPETYFLAQWAHETDYGTNTGSKNNNFAGIGAYSGSPYGINGESFSTKEAFVQRYISVLESDRYKGIFSAQNTTEFAQALKAGGYASDANYAYAGTWTEVPKLAGNINTVSNELNLNDLIKQGRNPKDYGINNPINPNATSDIADEQQAMQTEETWYNKIFNNVKYGFAIVILFVLTLFFLYGAFFKDSGLAGKVGNGVVNIATAGKAKMLKKVAQEV